MPLVPLKKKAVLEKGQSPATATAGDSVDGVLRDSNALYEVPKQSSVSVRRTETNGSEGSPGSLYQIPRSVDSDPRSRRKSAAVEDYDIVQRPRPLSKVSHAMPTDSLYDTPMVLTLNEVSPREQDAVQRESLHYRVENHESGSTDLYARPSSVLKPKQKKKTMNHAMPKPPRTNVPKSKMDSAISLPPDLPPRNSNRDSGNAGDIGMHAGALEGAINMESMSCNRCCDGFEPRAKIVNSNGDLFHPRCFVCAQCFRPFPDGVFYEFEGRKYCEHCFHVLYAPCCARCGEFIIGRVIKAMNATWHPQCFTCEMCHKELADLGFVKNQGRALCHECNAKVKAQGLGKYMCQKCHSVIDGDPLRFRGEVYHPYHFNCTACGIELTSTAREVRTRPGYTANELNELYCLRCHDKMGIPICGACRRPIEERVVTALGKHWHVEHFVCAKCEKPFLGNRHYERKGLAYCETHYHQLFGNLCYVCNQVIQGDIFTALNKAWCVNHFACSSCDQKMTVKTKFYEVDLKPVCKKCYEKYPRELRLRLKKYHENEAARDQGALAR